MRELNINSGTLFIQDASLSHSAFASYNPTQSTEPVARGEVKFDQYVNTDYLSAITLTGEEAGVEIAESRAEERAARTNHEVASTKSVALQVGVPGY